MLLGLQCERIAVDTRIRVAGVVHEGLDLVEVLAGLLLEAILSVEDELEAGKRTARHVGNGAAIVCETILEPLAHGDIGASCDGSGRGPGDEEGGTNKAKGNGSHDVGRAKVEASATVDNDGVGRQKTGCEVPETVECARTVIVRPNELLDGMVV